MKPLFFCFLILFFACKKEKLPLDPLPPTPSERFVTLTNHNWSMTHEYKDTTAYAKSHLNEWPLTSTYDSMNIFDTCSWDSKSVFLPNSDWQLIKSPSCDASVSTDTGHWKLINNDTDFVIVGQDTLHVVELSSTDFKMYYKSYTWVHNQIVLTEYVMWTFKATN